MLEVLITQFLVIDWRIIDGSFLLLFNASLGFLGLLVIEGPEPPLIVGGFFEELAEGVPGVLLLLRLPAGEGYVGRGCTFLSVGLLRVLPPAVGVLDIVQLALPRGALLGVVDFHLVELLDADEDVDGGLGRRPRPLDGIVGRQIVLAQLAFGSDPGPRLR